MSWKEEVKILHKAQQNTIYCDGLRKLGEPNGLKTGPFR
jgi:hypothetical protein